MNKKKENSKPIEESKKVNKEPSPFFKGFLKFCLLSFIICGVVFYCDSKGYFNPDKTKDHTIRKWNSFYELKDLGVHFDIMLFGNSHLYTGINPKNLGLTLGANAFIFASPGTNTADNYFALKEAIKAQKPELVIIETYPMSDFNPYELKEGALSNQIVSFSARHDLETKLVSTPYLFALKNYLYAWSTTIRNHDYIFTNPEQIESNKIINANPTNQKINNGRLYLGRYVRFTTGIEDSTLLKYETLGSPIKGAEFTYSKYAKNYTKKIIDLCEKEDIELIFLTLPMYEKHIENYPAYQQKFSELINQGSNHWFNLQIPSNYNGFGPYAFENTYNESQHMTYNGSLTATYKLAHYISDSLQFKFPNRSQDINWLKMYYGDEGYFENFSPAPNDTYNKILSSKSAFGNVTIESCCQLSQGNGASMVMLKINRDQLKAYSDYTKLNVLVSAIISNNGLEQTVDLNLKYDPYHQPKNMAIFSSIIKDVPINKVNNVIITE